MSDRHAIPTSAAISLTSFDPTLKWTCPVCKASLESWHIEFLWGYRAAHIQLHPESDLPAKEKVLNP